MSALKFITAQLNSGHTYNITSQFTGEDPLQEEHTFSLDADDQAVPYHREAEGNGSDDEKYIIHVRKSTAPPPYDIAAGGGQNNGDPVQVNFMECVHSQDNDYNITLHFISENNFRVTGSEYRQVALGSGAQSKYCMVVYYDEVENGTNEAQFENVNCFQGTEEEGVPLLVIQDSLNEPFRGNKHALIWISNT